MPKETALLCFFLDAIGEHAHHEVVPAEGPTFHYTAPGLPAMATLVGS